MLSGRFPKIWRPLPKVARLISRLRLPREQQCCLAGLSTELDAPRVRRKGLLRWRNLDAGLSRQDLRSKMTINTFSGAQADMRRAYCSGAPGVLVSGCAWLAAGLVAALRSPSLAVLVLLVGGALIHPASIVLNKVLGRAGAHTPGNPLGVLAIEGTVWFLAGIVIAYGLRALRLEWFFPAMLLLIGGRYLTFQTIYGLRVYWLCGAILGGAGLVLGLMRAPVPVAAFSGAGVELVFAALLFARDKRSTTAS